MAARLVEGCGESLLAPLRFLRPGRLPDSRPRPGARRQLAAELLAANRSYGHPRAEALVERFLDPATTVVVAGQQAGLFGGPLYTLTKLLALGRWCETLEAAGVPAVGLFWVASEDHDFDEVARAVIPGKERCHVLELGPDRQPLLPVGMRTLGAAVDPVKQELAELAGRRCDPQVWELLNDSYRPDAGFADAFCSFMTGLLGNRAPLLVDSMLPAMKEAQRPWLRLIIERRREIAAALADASRRVEQEGLELQVSERAAESPLFLLGQDERRRIVWEGSREWSLRGGRRAATEVQALLDIVAENPAAVSPGVLARPVLQDAVLGTGLQVMGPGELAYMAQAAPLYELLGIEAPYTTLRPQMLVLEARVRRHAEKLELPLADVLGDEDELRRRLGHGRGGELVDEARVAILERLAALEEPCLAIDSNLERPFEKTRHHVRHALELFGDKVCAAAVRHDELLRKRCRAVRGACLPLGAPQERVLSSAWFPLRFGREFVAAAWRQLEVGAGTIQIVKPEEGAAP